jgi:hypothetical protein
MTTSKQNVRVQQLDSGVTIRVVHDTGIEDFRNCHSWVSDTEGMLYIYRHNTLSTDNVQKEQVAQFAPMQWKFVTKLETTAQRLTP